LETSETDCGRLCRRQANMHLRAVRATWADTTGNETRIDSGHGRKCYHLRRSRHTPRSDRCVVSRSVARVRLTAWALSCTAKAYVPKPCGAAVAAHTAGQQRVFCN
jgi:hypothetical protein